MFRITVPDDLDIDALPPMEYRSSELKVEVEMRIAEMRAQNCTHKDHRPWPEIDNPCQDRENAAVGHEIDAIIWARLVQAEVNANPSASRKEILGSTATHSFWTHGARLSCRCNPPSETGQVTRCFKLPGWRYQTYLTYTYFHNCVVMPMSP